MTSTRPPITDPEKVREEIVAYLDGELSAEDSREVEERLATDPQFRSQLQQFERAWRLLDELPRTEPDAKLSATTVSIVAVRAADEMQRERQQWPRQYVRGWVLSAGSMLLALLLGFGMVAGAAALLSRAGVAPDADARLLADLPLLDNLDYYQQIDSVDFLRQLDKSGLFVTAQWELAGADELPLTPRIGPTPAERQAWIEGLSPLQKKQLAEKRERLESLAPENRKRLQELDRQLAADPRAEQLHEVLIRYARWLMTLPPDRRSELRGLKPDERLARVTALRQQTAKKLVRPQVMADFRTVAEWTLAQAERSEAQVVASLPERARAEYKKATAPARRRLLMLATLQHWQRNGFGHDPAVSPEALAELKQRLSPPLREQMDKTGKPEEQWNVLAKSLLSEIGPVLPQDIRRKIEAGGDATKQSPQLFPLLAETMLTRRTSATDDELWRYFHERMSKDERDNLQHLPREEFLQELRVRYQRAKTRERAAALRGAPDDLSDRPDLESPGFDRGPPPDGRGPDPHGPPDFDRRRPEHGPEHGGPGGPGRGFPRHDGMRRGEGLPEHGGPDDDDDGPPERGGPGGPGGGPRKPGGGPGGRGGGP
ncbi:MAG: hypothetical protein K8T25_03475 [Planctomycetia bacterium]|nr:hypothetical protein [Planctomycetia bacterium]